MPPQVEKVLDSKWFKMEREVYPPGVDPNAPDDEEGDEEDEEGADEEVRQLVPEPRFRGAERSCSGRRGAPD